MTRTRDMMPIEPAALLRRMFYDLDPWIEPRGFFPMPLRKTLAQVPWMPALEMTERDQMLFIKLDLPGMNKENVNVSFTDEGLVIKGERTQEIESKKDEWFTTERTYGHFHRVVPLPDGVNYKEVKATFKNGVLEVTVPVPAAEAKTPYRVPVEGEPETKNVKVAA
jgi:HSP20 family protein